MNAGRLLFRATRALTLIAACGCGVAALVGADRPADPAEPGTSFETTPRRGDPVERTAVLRRLEPGENAATESPPLATTLPGRYHVHYQDAALGEVSGVAEIARDLQSARVTLWHPQSGFEYQLTASSIVCEDDHVTMVLDGRSPSADAAVAPMRPADVTTFAVAPDATTAIAAAPGLGIELPLGPRRLQEWDRVTLRLKLGADRNLTGTWSYPADPATRRDFLGRGRVGEFATVMDDGRPQALQYGWEIWQAAPPIIAGVELLEEQVERTHPAIAPYEYPFRDENHPGWIARTLFVFGLNLPTTYADAREFESSDPSISYFVSHLHADAARAQFPIDDFARGWKLALAHLPPEQQAAAKQMDALIVAVRLARGVVPGPKHFTLNGAPGRWTLQFGDNFADIRFVRQAREDEADPANRVFHSGSEDTTHVFVHETIRAEIRTDLALPVETIRLILGVNGEVLPFGDEKYWPAQRLAGSRNIYRTPPLHLVPGNANASAPAGSAQRVVVHEGDKLLARLGDADLLLVRQQNEDASRGVAAAVRPARHKLYDAKAVVAVAPAHVGGFWREAVRRAAICLNERRARNRLLATIVPAIALTADVGPPIDLNELDGLPAADFEQLTYRIVNHWEKHTVEIKLRDVAAMILLRDEFVRQMQDLRARIPRLVSATQLRAFRDSIGPRMDDPNFPLALLQVRSPRTLDTQVPYRWLFGESPATDALARALGLERDPSASWLNESIQLGTSVPYSIAFREDFDAEFFRVYFGDDRAAARQWSDAAVREGLAQYRQNIDDAIARAEAAGDCDVGGLLEVTGLSFEPVKALLAPKMMRLVMEPGEEPRWEPDFSARAAIEGISVLARHVKSLEELKRADYACLQAEFALFTMGLTLSESALSAAVQLAVEGGDVAYSTVTSAWDYHDSKEEVAFAMGGAELLGTNRASLALANEESVFGVLANVSLGAVGSAAGGFQLSNALRRAHGIELLRGMRESGVARVARLTEAEARDLLNVLHEVRTTKADELTSAMKEAKALDRALVDEGQDLVAAVAGRLDELKARVPPVGEPLAAPRTFAQGADRPERPALAAADDAPAPTPEIGPPASTVRTTPPEATPGGGIAREVESAGAATSTGPTTTHPPATAVAGEPPRANAGGAATAESGIEVAPAAARSDSAVARPRPEVAAAENPPTSPVVAAEPPPLRPTEPPTTRPEVVRVEPEGNAAPARPGAAREIADATPATPQPIGEARPTTSGAQPVSPPARPEIVGGMRERGTPVEQPALSGGTAPPVPRPDFYAALDAPASGGRGSLRSEALGASPKTSPEARVALARFLGAEGVPSWPEIARTIDAQEPALRDQLLELRSWVWEQLTARYGESIKATGSAGKFSNDLDFSNLSARPGKQLLEIDDFLANGIDLGHGVRGFGPNWRQKLNMDTFLDPQLIHIYDRVDDAAARARIVHDPQLFRQAELIGLEQAHHNMPPDAFDEMLRTVLPEHPELNHANFGEFLDANLGPRATRQELLPGIDDALARFNATGDPAAAREIVDLQIQLNRITDDAYPSPGAVKRILTINEGMFEIPAGTRFELPSGRSLESLNGGVAPRQAGELKRIVRTLGDDAANAADARYLRERFAELQAGVPFDPVERYQNILNNIAYFEHQVHAAGPDPLVALQRYQSSKYEVRVLGNVAGLEGELPPPGGLVDSISEQVNRFYLERGPQIERYFGREGQAMSAAERAALRNEAAEFIEVLRSGNAALARRARKEAISAMNPRAVAFRLDAAGPGGAGATARFDEVLDPPPPTTRFDDVIRPPDAEVAAPRPGLLPGEAHANAPNPGDELTTAARAPLAPEELARARTAARDWAAELIASNPQKLSPREIQAELEAFVQRRKQVEDLFEAARRDPQNPAKLPPGVTFEQLELAVRGDPVTGQRVPLNFCVENGVLSTDLARAQRLFEEFQAEVAAVFEKHGIHDAVVVQLGSGTTGWSSSPGKVGKPWSPKSDVDFAIFSDDALIQAQAVGGQINPKTTVAGRYTTLRNGVEDGGGFYDTPLGRDLQELARRWDRRIYKDPDLEEGFDFKLNLDSDRPFKTAVPVLQVAEPRVIPLSPPAAPGTTRAAVSRGREGSYCAVSVRDPRFILPPNVPGRGEYHLTLLSPPEMAGLPPAVRARLEKGVDIAGAPRAGAIHRREFAGAPNYQLEVDWPEAQAWRRSLGLPEKELHVSLNGGLGDAARRLEAPNLIVPDEQP